MFYCDYLSCGFEIWIRMDWCGMLDVMMTI